MLETAFHPLRVSVFSLVVFAVGMVHADEKLDDMIKDGKFAKAVKYIEKSIPKDQRNVEVWLHYAKALEKSGADKKSTMQAFTEAQKVQPSDPRIFAALGKYHVRQKEYKTALKLLQKWYLLERSAVAAEALADCAMNLKMYDMARDAAESAVKLDSKAVESRKILSYIYFSDKNWAEAALQLEAIVAQEKDNVTYWKKLAHCYGELKNKKKLVVAAGQVVKFDSKDTRSRKIMIEHHMKNNDDDAAFSLLKELAVLTPEDAQVFKNLYTISLKKKKKEDAVLYLRNYQILDSTDAASFKILGDLLYEQKKLDEALDAYRKVLKIDPKFKGFYRPYIAILRKKNLEKELLFVAQKAISAAEADVELYAAVGDVYKKRKQCGKAIGYYNKALKKDMKNLSVLSSLAECQAATGKAREALLNYQQVVMLNPKAKSEYKYIGDLLAAQNKTAEAMENYRTYLEKVPDDEKIASVLGLYYHSQEKCKEAIAYFKKVKSEKLLTLSIVKITGDCYYRTGNYNNAITYYKKARTKKPPLSMQREILKPLAVSYEKTGSPVEAARAYEAYVKIAKEKDADAAYKQAALREKAEPGSAIALYRQNIKNFPKDARSFTRLGVLLSQDKSQKRQAVIMLEKASLLVPKDTFVLKSLCNAYRAVNNSTKELDVAVKLVALQPGNIEANKRAGMILYGKKQYEKSIPYLSIVEKSRPKEANIALMLADAFMQTKQPARAVEIYEKVNALQPDNEKVLMSLIAAASSANNTKKVAKYKEELAALDKKIVAKDGKNVDSRLRLADFYFSRKDYNAAYPIYKDLSGLTPKNRMVFSRLVTIALKKKKEKEALSYQKKYVGMDSKNAQARIDLGNLLVAQKKTDEALVEYRTAFKMDTSLTGYLKKFGEILVAKKHEDEAVPVLRKAIEKNEADQKMIITLGTIYQKKNRFADAIKMYQIALKKDPKDTGVLAMLGECQAKNKDVAGAVVTLEQVVLLNPKAVNEFKTLGDLQMEQKKEGEAIESYVKFLAKSSSGNDTVARTVGLYKYAKKQYGKALIYLEKVTNAALQNGEYLLALGDAYYQTKNCKKVVTAFGRLNTKKASEKILKTILKPLAECYKKTGDNGKAAEAYEKYVSLPGIKDADASYQRGFLREKSDPKAAQAFYRANMKSFPKDSRNYIRLGMMYAEDSSTLSKAHDPLTRASQLDPKNLSVLQKLAQVWNTLKNEDKELETYKKVLAQKPDHFEANLRVGTLLLKKEQFSKAVQPLERVSKEKPEDTGIMLMLSECYLKTGRKEEGAKLLAKVQGSQGQKKNHELMLRLYNVYKELGKKDEAEKMITQLIALKKENRYRLLYVGDLVEQKKYTEAKFITDEILKADPMSLEGLLFNGKILGLQKKYDDAMEALKMVSYVKEDYAPAYYERAEIYRKQGELNRAESYYVKALNFDPKYALAELGLARVFKTQNRLPDYKKHLEKAKSLDPDNREINAEIKSEARAPSPSKK